jgi:hypothetical protein
MKKPLVIDPANLTDNEKFGQSHTPRGSGNHATSICGVLANFLGHAVQGNQSGRKVVSNATPEILQPTIGLQSDMTGLSHFSSTSPYSSCVCLRTSWHQLHRKAGNVWCVLDAL